MSLPDFSQGNFPPANRPINILEATVNLRQGHSAARNKPFVGQTVRAEEWQHCRDSRYTPKTPGEGEGGGVLWTKGCVNPHSLLHTEADRGRKWVNSSLQEFSSSANTTSTLEDPTNDSKRRSNQIANTWPFIFTADSKKTQCKSTN